MDFKYLNSLAILYVDDIFSRPRKIQKMNYD